MARLIDVARLAGVSRSTASNVFNNPAVVRPAVRAKVEAAASELGYGGPDPKGRLLRAGKVNAIGIIPTGGWGIVDSLRNLAFREFLLGIGQACDEAGANLLLMSDATGREDMVRTALVDGFVVTRVEHVEVVEAARLRRLPVVVVDDDAGANVSSVRADAYSACREAARHLTGLGHRRFGIISFLRSFGEAVYHPPCIARTPAACGAPLDQEKYRGYCDGLAEAGIDVVQVPMVQAEPWDRDAAGLLFDKAPEVTAILSMADMQALSTIRTARARGRQVPRDLSVIGYNDIPEAANSEPPLTTIDGLVRERGRRAAQILFEGGEVRREVLPARLVVRGSTGPAPR